MLPMIRYVFGWAGPSGFGAGSTAEEVATAFAERAKDRVVVITGANSGIGLDAGKALAKVGAKVVLACRSLSNAEGAVKAIKEEVPEAKLFSLELDLSSFDSIRAFAEKFKKLDIPDANPDSGDGPVLHLLLNNAGVMACPKSATKDGHELQFGTNHLGHFLLTNLLSGALRRGAATGGWARVVNVASMGHWMARSSGIPFNDLKGDEQYEKWHRYAVSKLANILHAMELNKRLEGTGVTAYSLHPGVIATNLMRHQAAFLGSAQKTLSTLTLQKTIPQGAATTVYCALAPNIDTIENGAGGFFTDCNHDTTYRAAAASDAEAAKKLWDVSEQLTNSKL